MDDEESKLVTLLRRKQMPTQNYSDVAIVSAFNDLIDLDKWRGLPSNVRERFKTLLQHNRIKMVCFSDRLGFGLRVYEEKGALTFNNDEASVSGDLTVDPHGSWVRCPPAPLPTLEAKEWVVANEEGRRFIGPNARLEAPPRTAADTDEDEDEYETDGSEYPICDWRSLRSSAKKFTRAEADKWAAAVKGVVLKS